MGWQIAVDLVDRGLQTLERTDSLRGRTFNVVFKLQQVLQGSTVSANRQCCAASGKARQPIRRRRPCLGQVLTACHQAARLQWPQWRFCWGRQQWVGFYSLMSLGLTLVIHDGSIRVFRRRGERFADNCLTERDRFGGGSVMVWGGIMCRRKTNLIVVQGNVIAQGYINQILQLEAVPLSQRHWPAILMHDNARPHVARICRQFLDRNNVNVLPCLPFHRYESE